MLVTPFEFDLSDTLCRFPCSAGDSFFPVTEERPWAQASAISGCLAHKNRRWFSDLNGT